MQFLSRLKQQEDESVRHKQELTEKTYKQVSDIIEKKLAGEFKLCSGLEDDMRRAIKGSKLLKAIIPDLGVTICSLCHNKIPVSMRLPYVYFMLLNLIYFNVFALAWVINSIM